MPFIRRRSGFTLGAPKVVTFGLSLILVLLAVASALTHLPPELGIITTHRFWLVLIGYVILVLGVLLPGV